MQPTIPKTIFEVAEKYPRKIALMYKKGDSFVGISFRELKKRVEQFCSALISLGVEKGDRVAILSNNRPEWVISDLAIMNIGAITVPIHTTLSPRIIKHILQDSGARILIVNKQSQLNKVLLVEKELIDLRKILYFDIDHPEDIECSKALLSWEAELKRGKKFKLKPKQEVNHDDICSIVYTSGTTGLPKGVMLTHYNFLADARAALDYVPVTPKDTFLSFLPLSHVLERTAGYYAPLSRGCTIAYAESVKTLPKNLKEIKPTILISVPRIFEKMFDAIWEKLKKKPAYQKKLFSWALNQEPGTWQFFLGDLLVFRKIRKRLGGHLRLTISGGASLSEKLARFYDKIGILILEGYGLSETSPVVSVNKENKRKIRSAGVPLMGVEVKIADDKEILVRGPNVMSGYWKNEKATNQVIDERGWFHTGDLGFIDNEGFLFIIGRKKEMIVTSGGRNIWPEVIENNLNADRFIAQSMVVGHNQKYLGALIVPDLSEVKEYIKQHNLHYHSLEEMLSSVEILQLFRERIDWATKDLAEYEKVAKFILIPDEFSQKKDELTPTLKLRRHVVKDHYQKEIEEMFS
jgi:long-chain acyl-CoA synthetase